MQRLTVTHKTGYFYRRPVVFGDHRLMFRPRDSHDLRVIEATLTIEPAADVHWLFDVFNNSVAVASFSEAADSLQFTSSIIIDRYPLMQESYPIEPYARTLPFSYPIREMPDLGRTIERHYPDPDRMVAEWTRQFLGSSMAPTDTEQFLFDLNRTIQGELTYEARHEPGVQTPAETLALGSGSCRDYALLMMECARSVGLAARFVSGYLYDPALDGGPGGTVGAGSTHAWVQVYLPGAGWIEFDPTNASHGAQNLVPVAVARDPNQAIPVAGTFEGEAEDFVKMTADVEVRAVGVIEGAA